MIDSNRFSDWLGTSRLVFMHIPKTGGTSLHNILVNQFERHQVCPERFNHLQRWTTSDLAKFRLFSGHFDMAGINLIPGDKRIIALFREPKARILSLYYFWRAHKESVVENGNLHGPRLARRLHLLEFLRHNGDGIPGNIDNIISRTLLGKIFVGRNREYLYPKDEVFDRAMEAIQALACFGIMETFETSLRQITSKLNIPYPDKILTREIAVIHLRIQIWKLYGERS